MKRQLPSLMQVSESLSTASISPWLRDTRHVERTARPGLDAETAGNESRLDHQLNILKTDKSIPI